MDVMDRDHYGKVILLSVLLSLAMVTVTQGQAAFKAILTKTEKTVIPEGIAINPRGGKIYVTSIALRKIIAIDTSGTHQDFIKTGQHGFLEGLGIKIDSARQWVWSVSNRHQGKWYTSRIHAFDLKTHAVKHEYEIRDTIPHLFNDLALHPNGKIYITDTQSSAIYEVDPGIKKLTLFIQDSNLSRANGIVNHPNGTIYVATKQGLMYVDLMTRSVTPLTFGDSRKTFWLDGIVYWKNAIIGIAEEGVVKYSLNASGKQIIDEQLIDKKNKYFHEPTTAAVLSDNVYVIANSNLAAYNKNGESVDRIHDQLSPVVIVVYNLLAEVER